MLPCPLPGKSTAFQLTIFFLLEYIEHKKLTLSMLENAGGVFSDKKDKTSQPHKRRGYYGGAITALHAGDAKFW